MLRKRNDEYIRKIVQEQRNKEIEEIAKQEQNLQMTRKGTMNLNVEKHETLARTLKEEAPRKEESIMEHSTDELTQRKNNMIDNTLKTYKQELDEQIRQHESRFAKIYSTLDN